MESWSIIVAAISVVIAIISLSVSFATFYWANLRDKKSLHLVRIDRSGGFMGVSFAIVNSGTRNITVTSIDLGLRNGEGNSITFWLWDIASASKSQSFIESGQALHYVARLSETVDQDLVKSGHINSECSEEVYSLDLCIQVSWVDSKGQSYKSSGYLFTYDFRLSGQIFSRGTLDSKVELYKSASAF